MDVVADAGDGSAVVVRGEWDISNVRELRWALRRAAGSTDARRVMVDLTDTTFMDLTALAAVVAVHRTVGIRGGAVVVLCRGDGSVHRTLTVSGVGALLDVHIVDAHHVSHE